MSIVVSDADIGMRFTDYLASADATYRSALFNFLDDVEAQSKLVPFLESALRANSSNPDLSAVLARFSELKRSFEALQPDTRLGEAERLVLKSVTFEDVRVWIDKLARMRRTVCRIEPQPERVSTRDYGTGFLVAPDVVMTNEHVVRDFWNDPVKADRVVLRFDYEKGADGLTVLSGTECKLARRNPQGSTADPAAPEARPWQVISSPEAELDFALLRLERGIGDDVVDGSPRGVLKLTAQDFNPTDPVLILQHPNAAPLKLSFGAVTRLEPPNRVLYAVNTQGGSSGAPCLTQDLKVAAIHHYDVVQLNRGVMNRAILAYLDSKRDALGALGLAQFPA